MTERAGRQRLTNDDWGLESNCFVCEGRNAGGLRLELWADHDEGVVDTSFRFDETFSGAPTLVHGGVSLAVLDEVQAWAVIAIGGQWAVTVETSSRFLQPVWVGAQHRAVARVESSDGDRFTTVGWIEDADGVRCVESSASFAAIGEAQAISFIGGDVPHEHRSYLADTSDGGTDTSDDGADTSGAEAAEASASADPE